jgi:AraC-like DNA-binding protein
MNLSLPEKREAPEQFNFYDTEQEFRINLPFKNHLENILFIGTNSRHNWSTSLHYHDHFELCYLDYGQGNYAIDHSLNRFSQGEVLVTKPSEIHYGLAGGEDAFRLYYLGFKLDNMRFFSTQYYKLGLHRIVKDEGGVIKQIFEHIVAEIKQNKPFHAHMVEGLFIQLLTSVLRLYQDNHLINKSQTKQLSEPVIHVMNTLHQEIRYQHDVGQLAKEAHVSPSHLARQFKAYTGISIVKYMKMLCLDHAKYQLRETSKSVTQIAQDLHFNSIHSFSIFFKKFSGLTPTQYRASHTDYDSSSLSSG